MARCWIDDMSANFFGCNAASDAGPSKSRRASVRPSARLSLCDVAPLINISRRQRARPPQKVLWTPWHLISRSTARLTSGEVVNLCQRRLAGDEPEYCQRQLRCSRVEHSVDATLQKLTKTSRRAANQVKSGTRQGQPGRHWTDGVCRGPRTRGQTPVRRRPSAVVGRPFVRRVRRLSVSQVR